MNLRYTSKTPGYQLGTSDVPVKGPSQEPSCRCEAPKVGGRLLDRAATPQAPGLGCQESEAPPAPLPCGEQESARETPRKPRNQLCFSAEDYDDGIPNERPTKENRGKTHSQSILFSDFFNCIDRFRAPGNCSPSPRASYSVAEVPFTPQSEGAKHKVVNRRDKVWRHKRLWALTPTSKYCWECNAQDRDSHSNKIACPAKRSNKTVSIKDIAKHLPLLAQAVGRAV